MPFFKALLLIVAAVASGEAVISFAARLETDCYVYLLVGVLALGGWFLADYMETEHNRRIRLERQQVWARREEGLQ